MPRIVFIDHHRRRHAVDAENGVSLMQAALDAGVAGILGECGGCCSCATCHVFVDAAWQARIAAAGDDEKMALEGALDPRTDSRLACQIRVEPQLDGIVLHVPERQI